jgi:hypothetical protein
VFFSEVMNAIFDLADLAQQRAARERENYVENPP